MPPSTLAVLLLAVLFCGSPAQTAQAPWPKGTWEQEITGFRDCTGLPVEPDADDTRDPAVWEVTAAIVTTAAVHNVASLKRRAVICTMFGPR